MLSRASSGNDKLDAIRAEIDATGAAIDALVSKFKSGDEACIVVYGLTVRICAQSRDTLTELLAYLPDNWQFVDRLVTGIDRCYSVVEHGSRWHLYADGEPLDHGDGRERLLAAFESDIDFLVAVKARTHVLVHAGVVRWQKQAIVTANVVVSITGEPIFCRVGLDLFWMVITTGRILNRKMLGRNWTTRCDIWCMRLMNLMKNTTNVSLVVLIKLRSHFRN